MSTERTSFGFNSLLPQSYKNKAEAFAKCLQDKLKLLGGVDDGPECLGNGKKRLHTEKEQNQQMGANFSFDIKSFPDENIYLQHPEQMAYKQQTAANRESDRKNGQWAIVQKNGSTIHDRRGYSSDSGDSEDEQDHRSHMNKYVQDESGAESYHNGSSTSELVLNSHKQSELLHKRVQELINGKSDKTSQDGNEPTRRKLESFNSEDSTGESWCSCEETPSDYEFNDETDDNDQHVDQLASQIRGSPRLKTVKVRNKRRGHRGSPPPPPPPPVSSNDVFFDFDVECFSPVKVEEFDSNDRLILPQANVEESPPTDSVPTNISDVDLISTKEMLHALSASPEQHRALLTPPPSPEVPAEEQQPVNTDFVINLKNLETKTKETSKESRGLHENDVQQSHYVPTIENKEAEEGIADVDEDAKTELKADLSESEKIRTNFAEIVSDPENLYESVKEAEISIPVVESTFERSGGIIVECPNWNRSNVIIATTLWDDFDSGKSKDSEESEEGQSATRGGQLEDETEDSDMLNPRMKLRRCSSLKTWKTPPGTPGRKKIVRFADALGLDLANVRTFLDEIPKIPSSAYEDLQCDLNISVERNSPAVTPTLMPTFAQPGSQPDFMNRIRKCNICLESAVLTDTTVLTISGCVRVRNLDYNKSVHVRYTLDNWQTFSDLQATYVPQSCDGFSDKFSFVLYGHTLKIGQKLDFALRLEACGCQYWDNNAGSNYTFQCLPQSPANSVFAQLTDSSVENDNSWAKFY